MKNKIFPVFLLLAFLLHPGFFELNSESVKTKKDQEGLQEQVVVTLKLVQVHVTDKEGNPIKDLTKDDFILYDNRKLQIITDFEKHFLSVPEKPIKPEKKVVEKIGETKLPPSPEISSRMNRKFIFLFASGQVRDISVSGISKSKKAALHFIDTQIQPTDEVEVMSYYWISGLELHEYFTSDMEKVKEAIKNISGSQGTGLRDLSGKTLRAERAQVEATARKGAGVGAGGPDSLDLISLTSFSAPELLIREALAPVFVDQLKELAQSMRSIPGIKNVILFSDGIPRSFLFGGSQTLLKNYEEMGREFAASNSPVHTVSTIGPGTDTSLEMLSEITGGQYFHTVDYYDEIAEKIQSVSGNYYVLGYYIDESWDGKYHDIKVEVKRQGSQVYGQKGYFNSRPFTELTEVQKKLHLIDLAMADNPYFQEPFNFSLIPLPCYSQEKSNFVLLTEIPLDRMGKIAGRKTELVTFITDKKHDMFASSRAEINFLEIPQKTVYHYLISSLPTGHFYECRVVLRNLETGDGAVALSSVEIPEELDSGLRLYPPLLLIPEKEAFYLKALKEEKKKPKSEPLSIANIYPFISNRHSPLVDTLEKGNSKLFAIVHCSYREIDKPEIVLSVHLTQLLSGEKTQLIYSTLRTEEEKDSNVFLIEINLPEMLPGRYSLEMAAQDTASGSESQTVQTFDVK
ncbi:MAG: VWA domain-containing protein [Candidatus Aminicenantes bacterium]|nr:VWA domain-containing protein [Candidatus Aminicenantes bacterium]